MAWAGPRVVSRSVQGLDAILAHGSAAEPIERFLQPAQLSVSDATAQEGSPVVFEVSLSRSASNAVSVDYRTADGTATAGADYEAASGTLSFAPGETSKTVSVTTLDDAHDEGEETLTLVLSDTRGAQIADGGEVRLFCYSEDRAKKERGIAYQLVQVIRKTLDERGPVVPYARFRPRKLLRRIQLILGLVNFG